MRSWCQVFPEYLLSYSCEQWIYCFSGAVARSFTSLQFRSFLAVTRVLPICFFVVCRSSLRVLRESRQLRGCSLYNWLLTSIFFTSLRPKYAHQLCSTLALFSSFWKIKFCTHVWNGLDTAYLNEHRNAQVELLSNYTQHSALQLLFPRLGKKFSFYGTWSYIYTNVPSLMICKTDESIPRPYMHSL